MLFHVEYLRSTCILLENQVLAAKLWMFLYLQNLAAKITSQQSIFDGFRTLSAISSVLRQIFRKVCVRKVRKDMFYIKSRQPSEQKFKMRIKCPNRTLNWVLGNMKSKSGFIIFFPSVTVHYAMVTNDTLFGNTP